MKQLIDLIGKLISFELSENALGETIKIKGLGIYTKSQATFGIFTKSHVSHKAQALQRIHEFCLIQRSRQAQAVTCHAAFA